MQIELEAALRTHFGYDAFRAGQEAIVRSVLSGRPTIAILPTGGGKSLCYQLPALLFEGTTVVVSPLVALMKDQVDGLRARGIAATFVNSSLGESEQKERQAAIRRGELRLVYVAPERFKSPSFLSAMSGLNVPLLAVDEAHCISAWGHDFRPEYQRIAQAREALRAARVLALTATATPEVRRDIADALELKDPKVFVAGFDRPNLFIEVLRVSGDKDKLGRVLALARGGGPGIVYAATRRNVEKIVAALREGGVEAAGYHAGMDDDERSRVQDGFLNGRTGVIVATNAFGMGVDKPDIRFVAHFDTPRSLEAYYQEIGRAGRDGQPSYALLLFNWADVMMQRRLIDAGRPSRDLIAVAWEHARNLGEGSLDELARACGATMPELSGAVRLLESAGHFERGRGRATGFAVRTRDVSADELAVDFELLELRVARERQMLERLVRFADTRGCRRHNLLRYFGDGDSPRSCTACESCAGSRAPQAEEVRASVRKERKAAARVEEGEYDASVFEKLRALRTELAREQKVPPYVIFHDATLRELARALPWDEKSFLAVKGAGPSRWEKYGARVVALTGASRGQPAAYVARAPTESVPPAREPVLARIPRAAPTPARPGGAPPPWLDEPPPPLEEPGPDRQRGDERLVALCQRGASLPELVRELRRPAAEIASELAEALHGGARLDIGRLLGADRVAAIRAAAHGTEGDVVAIRKRLPFAAALAEIRLALM